MIFRCGCDYNYIDIPQACASWFIDSTLVFGSRRVVLCGTAGSFMGNGSGLSEDWQHGVAGPPMMVLPFNACNFSRRAERCVPNTQLVALKVGKLVWKWQVNNLLMIRSFKKAEVGQVIESLVLGAQLELLTLVILYNSSPNLNYRTSSLKLRSCVRTQPTLINYQKIENSLSVTR